MAQYMDVVRECSPQTAVILEELDISYVTMERRLRQTPPGRGGRLEKQVRRMKRYERSQWKRFDGLVVMSEVDRLEVECHSDPSRVFVVPNGVDTSHFAFQVKRPPGLPRILFFGSLDHFPNRHGLGLFLKKIWPEFLTRHPEAKLDVLGEGVSRKLLASASDGVVFHGYVKDIRPFLHEASILAVPVWIGSGTRLKILEAFASGLPVVSTRIGCEGLAVRPDEHFLLADHPNEFVMQLDRLMTDPGTARRLASRARELVEELYDWQIVAKQAEAVWETVCWSLGARCRPAR